MMIVSTMIVLHKLVNKFFECHSLSAAALQPLSCELQYFTVKFLLNFILLLNICALYIVQAL